MTLGVLEWDEQKFKSVFENFINLRQILICNLKKKDPPYVSVSEGTIFLTFALGYQSKVSKIQTETIKQSCSH